MTKETEAKFLRLLGGDAAQAWERINNIREKLIRFFARRNSSDSEILTDETILRALHAIDEGKELTCQIETFLFAIAKLVALEDHRLRRKMPVPLDDLPVGNEPYVGSPDDKPPLAVWEQERYHECLQQCLQTLEPLQRHILILFYEGSEEGEQKERRKEIAERLGINAEALGQRIGRLRKKLEVCIKLCVEEHGVE